MPYKSADVARARNKAYYAANQDKIRGQARKWRENNPERHRENAKRARLINPEKYKAHSAEWNKRHAGENRVYGWRKLGINLTVKGFKELDIKQDGKCAICGKPETSGRYKNLTVDHDHESGVVRGLLCGRCNRSIGAFEDNPDLLRAAAEYLERER